jgi:hypothetical protein
MVKRLTLVLSVVAFVAAPESAQAETCFAKGETQAGLNKICHYSCLGEDASIRISGIKLCPLSIQNPAKADQSQPRRRSYEFTSPGAIVGESLRDGSDTRYLLDQRLKTTPILIFAGRNHDVFLGCLNCAETSANSVLNPLGKYGSELSSSSLMNPLSRYGNSLQTDSPCNQLASSPPVLVDEQGNYYGELTLNEFRPKRAMSATVTAWLTATCKGR